MKTKKESFFWTSYSDLMTSLFFIMLVLFVLVVILMHNRLVATEHELASIKKINKSIEQIDKNYFEYDSTFQRHTLKNVTASFKTQSSNIYDITNADRIKLLNAGRAIVKFMNTAKDSVPGAEYLLIIEGQSSRDAYVRNYELSYERSLALIRYWGKNGIIFDSLPCEVIISGSGCESRFRIQPDVFGNKDNQRFVIHIIPKPGKL